MPETEKPKYCLDTNTVSEILRGNAKTVSAMKAVIDNGSFCVIPPVVYYEIMRGLLSGVSMRKMERFEWLLREIWDTMVMDEPVFLKSAEIYADLRKQGQIIEDDDIFIGATALINNCILVTDNVKHFSRIQGMKIENWIH